MIVIALTDDKLLLTYAVVAIVVVLSDVAGVGALGVPVKVGEAIRAYEAKLLLTYAVLAIVVVLSDVAGVGTLGVPVKVGEAIRAYGVKAELVI